jgi:hypothetical protein
MVIRWHIIQRLDLSRQNARAKRGMSTYHDPQLLARFRNLTFKISVAQSETSGPSISTLQTLLALLIVAAPTSDN